MKMDMFILMPIYSDNAKRLLQQDCHQVEYRTATGVKMDCISTFKKLIMIQTKQSTSLSKENDKKNGTIILKSSSNDKRFRYSII
jgi:hypothetical protein